MDRSHFCLLYKSEYYFKITDMESPFYTEYLILYMALKSVWILKLHILTLVTYHCVTRTFPLDL